MSAKIKSWGGTDFRGFELLDIEPTTYVVTLEGANGVGKSNAMLALLGAIDPGRLDGEVVSYGKSKATTYVDLTMESGAVLRIKRSFKRGGGTECSIDKIDGRETTSYKGIREILAKMLGPFQNVTEILDVRTPAQERELGYSLLRAADVDLTAYDTAIEEALRERTAANGARTRADARLAGLPIPLATWPMAESSMTAALAVIDQHEKERRVADEAMSKLEALRGDGERLVAERASLQQRLREIESALESHTKLFDKQAEEAKALVASAPSAADIEAERNALHDIEERNANARRRAEYDAAFEEAQAAEEQAKRAEQAVADARRAKSELLASTTLAIDGLTISEDGSVRYNGVGFHELSDGQRLLVGTAVAIKTKGSLDAVFLERAESLDEENSKLLSDLCGREGVTLVKAQTIKTGRSLVVLGADYRAKAGKTQRAQDGETEPAAS